MIVLIIILSIVFFFLLCVLLPVSVDLQFDTKAVFKVKYCGIKVFDNKKPFKTQKEEPKENSGEKSEKPIVKFFRKQKEEKGFFGAVKFCFSLLNIIIKSGFSVIKQIKIEKLRLSLIVATNNAANTAIEYGAVCAAVYPPLSKLEHVGSLKTEKIDISANFDNGESKASLSFVAKSNLLNFILCAIKGYVEYKKLEREWKK